jgi:hypothetical protein
MTEYQPVPEWQIQLQNMLGPASTIYYWALFLAGLILCIWTFYKIREKGYLLLALFFLSPFFGVLMSNLSRQIHKAEMEKNQTVISDVSEIRPAFRHTKTSIRIPFFETALVVGLYFVSRNQIRKANQTVEPSGAPPLAHG